jgi:hypothetical protein
MNALYLKCACVGELCSVTPPEIFILDYAKVTLTDCDLSASPFFNSGGAEALDISAHAVWVGGYTDIPISVMHEFDCPPEVGMGNHNNNNKQQQQQETTWKCLQI